MKRHLKGITPAILALCMLLCSGAYAFAADFGGDTVTIVSWGLMDGEFNPGGRSEGRLEEAEAKFNCRIEFLAFEYYDFLSGLTTRLLAGESANDLWVIHNRQYWPLVAQNALLPLDDVAPAGYYERLPELSRSIAESLRYQGKIYGFGNPDTFYALKFIAYNKDLIAREGLIDPQELYEAGEWTWENATEIARKLTKDTDGDGSVDQWGISEFPWAFPAAFALSNDAPITKADETGKVVFAFDEKNALDALNQLYQWQTVDKITGAPGDWQGTQFVAGKVGMQFLALYQLANDVFNKMEDSYGVVPLPKGPGAADYRYPAEALTTRVLPSNCENAEAMLELEQFLWPADEYYDHVQESIMGYVRDRDSAEILMNAHESWSGECVSLEDVIIYQLAPAMTEVIYGVKSPAAAMEEVKAVCQAALDDLFGAQ